MVRSGEGWLPGAHGRGVRGVDREGGEEGGRGKERERTLRSVHPHTKHPSHHGGSKPRPHPNLITSQRSYLQYHPSPWRACLQHKCCGDSSVGSTAQDTRRKEVLVQAETQWVSQVQATVQSRGRSAVQPPSFLSSQRGVWKPWRP